MEFEAQEIFEFNPFNSQMNWFKSDANSNCNTWNQNMTEEMMNSYSCVPNCHSDMYYQQQHLHHHHHHQQRHNNQQAPNSHIATQQYDYYEQHTYYHPPENHHANLNQNYDTTYDYPSMQNSVESCDSMIDDQPTMSYPTTNMLDTSQFSSISNQENQPKPCFYCTICNMKFSRLYHLKRHFESGTHKTTVKENNIEDPAESLLQFYKQPKESQKYECQMCSKKYKNKISLKRHLTVHNGLKNVLWCQFNTLRYNTETAACCGIDCNTMIKQEN